MNPPQPEDVDQKLVRALGHPLRRRILLAMTEREASPSELARQFKVPIGNVSYHTNVLCDECECIEETKTIPRRGAVEHFFRARPHAGIGKREWQKLPDLLRDSVAGAAVDAFSARVVEAVEAGTFLQREGSGLHWHQLEVDEEAWREIKAILKGVEKAIAAITAKASERVEERARVIVAVSAFEMPPASE
jgi:DNA-binding transcriptional ArsR family regulator